MENPIKMDDLGVPLILETPICDLYVRLGFLKKRKLSPMIWMNFGSSSLDLCIQSPGPTVPRALLRRMCLAAMDQNFLEAGDWTCQTWICWWWISCYRGKSQFWEDVLLFPSFSNPTQIQRVFVFSVVHFEWLNKPMDESICVVIATFRSNQFEGLIWSDSIVTELSHKDLEHDSVIGFR